MIVTTLEKHIKHFRRWKRKQNFCLEQRLSQRCLEVESTELTSWAKEKVFVQGKQKKPQAVESKCQMFSCESLPYHEVRKEQQDVWKKSTESWKKKKELMIDNEKKKNHLESFPLRRT